MNDADRWSNKIREQQAVAILKQLYAQQERRFGVAPMRCPL